MVDTRGLSCLCLVIIVQKAIRKGAPDSPEILADAKTAAENITRFTRSQGYQVSVSRDGQDFKLTLTK